jgi:hypothetical protein
VPTNRKRVGRVGGSVVTDRAVSIYRNGLAERDRQKRNQASFALAEELRVDVCLPCLLERSPCFLLAVMDEGPYRETWAEIKAELDAAVQA